MAACRSTSKTHSAFAAITPCLMSRKIASGNPESILRDIKQGVIAAKAECVFEVDRHAAIARALKLARHGDFVLLAGKGHENYQIFADRTIYFDDREVAREILKHGRSRDALP